jgi:hypothetical protein
MMLLGRRGWAVANKGLKMGNETAGFNELNQRFNELNEKFGQVLEALNNTHGRLTRIEEELKSCGAGVGEFEPMMPGMMPGAMPGMMPGAMPGMMPGAMPGMMPFPGPWTIWWAWWLSWLVWPFALPLAASGMFPYTSRFAAGRAQFWSSWLEALARMTQQAAGPYMGRSPGKPVDPGAMKKLKQSLDQGDLQSLSKEAKDHILFSVQAGAAWTHAFQR